MKVLDEGMVLKSNIFVVAKIENVIAKSLFAILTLGCTEISLT